MIFTGSLHLGENFPEATGAVSQVLPGVASSTVHPVIIHRSQEVLF